MTLSEFNNQEKAVASDSLFTCCGSEKWTALLLQQFPFSSEQQLVEICTRVWYEECEESDWLEAFGHHPKIGNATNLDEKFASSKHLAAEEQSAVSTAAKKTIDELVKANQAYEEKFGFIFIVCATGKTATEMLNLLYERMKNSYHEELHVAMGEQQKITLLRLKKLLTEGNWSWIKNSQLTTHVLDTSTGRPAEEVSIRLQQQINGNTWQTMALGITNKDGRVPDLLPAQRKLIPGAYQLIFDTGSYFRKKNMESFYPGIDVRFIISGEEHYHVPLLLNPFGYSTYRGS